MIVGALQLKVVQGDKQTNLDKVDRLLSDQQVNLAVLPELFSTGYYFESAEAIRALAEPVPQGSSTVRLCEIAAAHNCHLVGTLIEQDRNRCYITAVVVGPQGYIGKHRKRHLAEGEDLAFSPGEESVVFDLAGCKTGAVVCFEGWFPESFRELILQGAQVICDSLLTRSQDTLDMLRVRAMENRVFVVVANSIATERHGGETITWRGDSRIIDYEGRVLAEAGQEERLITAVIDEQATAVKSIENCDLTAEIRKHRYR